MGWVCRELVVKLNEDKWIEENQHELLSYVKKYDSDSSSITLDGGNLIFYELYYDPDAVISDIVEVFHGKWFEGKAHTQSEISGEHQVLITFMMEN